jgi:hypothetical protein
MTFYFTYTRNVFNSSFIDVETGDLVSFLNINRAFWQDITITGNGPWDKSMSNMVYGMQYATEYSAANWSYNGWAVRDGDVAKSEVPEPSTLAIFALGIMGLVSRHKKRQ